MNSDGVKDESDESTLLSSPMSTPENSLPPNLPETYQTSRSRTTRKRSSSLKCRSIWRVLRTSQYIHRQYLCVYLVKRSTAHTESQLWDFYGSPSPGPISSFSPPTMSILTCHANLDRVELSIATVIACAMMDHGPCSHKLRLGHFFAKNTLVIISSSRWAAYPRRIHE